MSKQNNIKEKILKKKEMDNADCHYEGNFKNNKYDGKGKLTKKFTDRTVETYKGDFQDQYHSKGELTSKRFTCWETILLWVSKNSRAIEGKRRRHGGGSKRNKSVVFKKRFTE